MNTILIVDDEQCVRESISDYLSDRGWLTLAAKSAEDALEVLKSESPSAAVVDMRLPGVDGGEFIRQAYSTSPTMSFVVYTGSPEYRLPADLRKLDRVSNRLLKKTTTGLAILEQELVRMIELTTGRKMPGV